MTIGEKITTLRTAQDLSQEELAERLDVSRQSVSKWEIGEALPGTDKVLALAELFQISVDALLRDEIKLSVDQSKTPLRAAPPFKNQFFGTDGFRGRANIDITALQAFKIGRFLGWYYGSELSGCREYGYRPKFALGKDTRRSSYMFEYAIAAGLAASGADVYMLHVTTTPSVSYVTRQDGFDCGIMISASHNPYTDNGIKLVNRYGEKMDERTLALCEAYLSGDLKALGLEPTKASTPSNAKATSNLDAEPADLPLAEADQIGAIIDHSAGRNRYIAYLISLASHSFKGLKIGLDCANGASWMIAPAVMSALGAQVFTIGDHPSGTNINADSGSTHLENLQKFVLEHHLDAGFAFDGDADRCLAVDEKGRVVSGDHILYILARRLADRGMLSGQTVVSTIMSNGGLKHSLSKLGIDVVETGVGDQSVYAAMSEGEFMLGGEPSGHIILSKYATTGDGILTAIMLLEEIMDRKSPFSKLIDPVTIFPQVLRNLPVRDKSAVLADSDIQGKIDKLRAKLGPGGKIILRPSGTEPVVRLLVEGSDAALCEQAITTLANLITKKGY